VNSATTTPWPHNHRPGRRQPAYPASPANRQANPTGQRARPRVEDHLAGNPGQPPRPARGPSPARLNAVGTPSPLELRRAQEPRAAHASCRTLTPGPASQGGRQHARKPGDIPDPTHHLREHPQHATATLGSATEITTRDRLTNLPLRWFPRKRGPGSPGATRRPGGAAARRADQRQGSAQHRGPVTSEVGAVLSDAVDALARTGATVTEGWPEGIDPGQSAESFGFQIGLFFAYQQAGGEQGPLATQGRSGTARSRRRTASGRTATSRSGSRTRRWPACRPCQLLADVTGGFQPPAGPGAAAPADSPSSASR
jgi:hypothetical protein